MRRLSWEWRRWAWLAYWVGICGTGGPGCEPSQQDEASRQGEPVRAPRPNVLLVTLDTTRADHLGCYGYPGQITPNLDRLAAQGTLFTRAISQAAVTPVSHASILTGLNPYSHGLRVMHGLTWNRLADHHVTLAEVLVKHGYQTAAFVSAFPVTERFGLHQGFATFDADFLNVPIQVLVSPDGAISTRGAQRRAGDTTDLVLAWLAQPHDGPYFLWLHYFDPHDPWVLPPGVKPLGLSDPVRESLRRIYDLEIGYMDQQIGRVLEELDVTEQLDNTVIVVAADHGEGLGDHDWWTHGILYQEQVRVPLIVCAPSYPGGRRVDYVVRCIDIMPTVLDLVKLDRTRWPRMDGESLVPLLSGGAPDPHYAAYSDSVNMLTYNFAPGIKDVKDHMLFAVVEGDWKYVHRGHRERPNELYNLAKDPGELNNLVELRPQKRRRLLDNLLARDFLPRHEQKPERMSPEDTERLRSLGYVEPADSAE